MAPIDDATVQLARWSMDLAQLRATVAANNVANASTPGFRAQQVDFAASLAEAKAALADPQRLAAALAQLEAAGFAVVSAPPSSALGAAVSLDDQVAEMTFASTQYQALADALGRHFVLQRLAIGQKG